NDGKRDKAGRIRGKRVTQKIAAQNKEAISLETALAMFLTGQKSDEAVRGKVGLKKFCRGAGGSEHRFHCEVTAANGAFHGGGPAGLRPVAGKKQARDFCVLRRTPAIDAGLGREGGRGFLDDRGFDELRFAGRG